MNKSICFFLSLLLVFCFVLPGCNQNAGNSSTETFKKTTVFNPNSTKVKLISVNSTSRASDEEVVCEVESHASKEVQLGDEHTYYFTDSEGNKIADLDKGSSGEYLPVYLELNEPKDGSKYLLLNQFKKENVLEKFSREDYNGDVYDTYNLFLFEIIEENALDAYKYGDIYIREYPSGNYWVKGEGYASNMLGTEITYDEDFRNNLEQLSNPWAAWGWGTWNAEFKMWFCHRVVSYIWNAKNDSEFTPKVIGQKTEISLYNPLDTDVEIQDSMYTVIETVKAKTAVTMNLYRDYAYYFYDAGRQVRINIPAEGQTYNFVLKRECPIPGKKILVSE